MTYCCDRCGREWEEAAARENDLGCTRRCGGTLHPIEDAIHVLSTYAASLAQDAEPDHFFPPDASEDPLGDTVIHTFPFPLALTYHRLQQAMDRQDTVAAAWQLRDAFECVVRFTACLAIADMLEVEAERGSGDTSPDLERILRLLFKPTGLSLGDWHTLLETTLRSLQPLAREARLAESRRKLPGLYTLFFTPAGKPTRLNSSIDGSERSFVHWRNRVFGHGVFRQDRSFYAAQTIDWLTPLRELYQALAPVINEWKLVSFAPGEEGERDAMVTWQGAGDIADVERHTHHPAGNSRPLFLLPPGTRRDSINSNDAAAENGEILRLGPLLSVQQCVVCSQPAAFFFDKFKRGSDIGKGDRTTLLEYFRGHNSERRNWDDVKSLANLLPVDFKWERTHYDAQELEGLDSSLFASLKEEYIRPGYLLEEIEERSRKKAPGYLLLTGPGGSGKSSLVWGLDWEQEEQGIPVLAYHVLPGARQDYRTFIPELDQQARAHPRLRQRTQQSQTSVSAIAELATEFGSYLKELMKANHIQQLILAIDALDHLADPEPGGASIADLLPTALPPGCLVLLTARENLSPHTRECLQRIRASRILQEISLNPGTPNSKDLVREYLQRQLPEPLRQGGGIDEILRRSEGLFLYASLYCQSLKSGAFRTAEALPEPSAFYHAYLERLREQVGGDIYRELYEPVLMLICAAQQPAAPEQLQRWGISLQKLPRILEDLSIFLRESRGYSWTESLGEGEQERRYAPAHEELLRYIQPCWFL